MNAAACVRRARPALGTLLEIGVRGCTTGAVAAAFARVAAVEAQLSRFDVQSAIHRFNAAPAGARIEIGADAMAVLAAARELRDASDGGFDISLGTGADGWCVEPSPTPCRPSTLHKRRGGVSLDLGGIGKGYAVDAAVEALQAFGIEAGWVNAGGDLRVFGPIDVPIDVRDETTGGVRRFGSLGAGAFATSRLAGRQVSVAAERCLWADALTKLVAAHGDAAHPLLARYGAVAWLH